MHYLHKALELDLQLANALNLYAMMAYLVEWNWEKEFINALVLNLNDALYRTYYSLVIINFK